MSQALKTRVEGLAEELRSINIDFEKSPTPENQERLDKGMSDLDQAMKALDGSKGASGALARRAGCCRTLCAHA